MTKEELKQKAYEYAIKEIPFIECITQNDLEILVQQAYITGAEPREKRIAELEKENAELKKLKRECETSLCRAEYQYNYEQLTKAKEIIREFMKYEINEYDGSLEIHFEELKKQAEQFLKE